MKFYVLHLILSDFILSFKANRKKITHRRAQDGDRMVKICSPARINFLLEINQASKPMPVLLKQSNPVSIEYVANFLRMHR